jgi:APA family basic amino acid/polyamine antiporter
MIAVLWAYEGWQWVTYTASETINPQRNFPRGFLIGTLLLIVVYVVADVAYLVALGPADAARSDTIAATAVAAVLGSGTAKFVALTILISVFSTTNSGMLQAPRVYYAMARDGLFFRRLADVSPRFRTPAFAIVTSGTWSAILAWSGTFQQLFTYVVFAGWVFYGLAAASIFVFRRRERGAKRPYSVPGYPWTPLAFVLASGAVVVNTIVSDWRDAAFGLGIMALGLPAYFFWRSRRSAPAA